MHDIAHALKMGEAISFPKKKNTILFQLKFEECQFDLSVKMSKALSRSPSMPSQSGTPNQDLNHGFHLFYMQLLSPKILQQINGTQNYKLRMISIWPTIFA